MRSDDLRPIGPRTWAVQCEETAAALRHYNVGPAPFVLQGQEPAATILKWNDPKPTIDRKRAYRAEYYRAQKAKRPSPPIQTPAPPIARRSSPRNDALARQLVGLSSMSTAKIADFCGLPIADVVAMRATLEIRK